MRRKEMEGWRKKIWEGRERGAQKKDMMTSFRVDNITVFMLGLFASQHRQIYFTTKDIKSKRVSKMSLSAGSPIIPTCNKYMVGLLTSNHPCGPCQVLVFSHKLAQMTKTWIFILSQSGSTVIVAGLWKPKVEISGHRNYSPLAGKVEHPPYRLFNWGQAKWHWHRDRKAYSLKISVKSVSLVPGKLKITSCCPDESWKTQSVKEN